MKLFVVLAAYLVLSTGTVFSGEETFVFFPNDKPVIELNFPDGFKTALRKDGTCLAVGPKSVMALASMEKVKDAAAAKSALPGFAKSFALRSLSFRELNVVGVEDAKLPRPYTEGEAIGTKVLAGSGKNSDGDEMFVSVTAFPWNHRYFVLFAVAKPADKEQLEKDRRSVLETVTDVNDD
ncbi:MAG TPA: hypothetical protein VE031_03025 [Chthoniobacterales bacterium]|nr:hypothetical protein [Chthoniobacterales bacterium]